MVDQKEAKVAEMASPMMCRPGFWQFLRNRDNKAESTRSSPIVRGCARFGAKYSDAGSDEIGAAGRSSKGKSLNLRGPQKHGRMIMASTTLWGWSGGPCIVVGLRVRAKDLLPVASGASTVLSKDASLPPRCEGERNEENAIFRE
jgi:hypothetical protein